MIIDKSKIVAKYINNKETADGEISEEVRR